MPPRTTPNALLSLAERHGLTGMLPDDPAVIGERAAARAATVARYLRARSDLDRVREALDGVGGPWLAVKGPVVATGLYPRPDLRPFSDIDVLVSPARLDRVLAALEEQGGRCLVRNWPRLVELGLAELPLLLPAGSVLDLHWHLVHRAAARRTWRLDTAGLLDRSVPARGLTGIHTLDPVATVVHLAWHSTKSGGTRLLWACDVELAAAELPATAGRQLRELCRVTRTTLPVALALDWAALAFPDGAAARLATELPTAAWRSVARAAKRRQLRRPPGSRSGEALPRATRVSTAGSAIAVLGQGLGSLQRRPPGSIGDAAAEGPSRADYLALVTAGRL